MIVPIWAAAWEIECCHPDATVGERWEAPLKFDPDPRVWWARDAGVEAPPEAHQLGLLEVDLSRVPSPDSRPILFRHGTLTFSAPPDLSEGHHVGRLWLDAHAEPPHELRTARGKVARVDVVPLEYELVADRMYEARGQLPPRSVNSTLDRKSVVPPRDLHAPKFIGTMLLVWLDAN